MTDYGRLLNNISQELKIKKDKEESELYWAARVIYSSLGRIAQASLFDDLEDGEDISVVRFKNRIIRTLLAYFDIYPDIKEIYTLQPEIYADEIYEIFLNTGCLYHSPNRLAPSVKKSASYQNVSFIRGEIGGNYRVSGLGTYVLADYKDDNPDKLYEMYKISDCNLEEIYNRFLLKGLWEEFNYEGYTEYLRTKGPFSDGYWINKPEKIDDFSLMRVNKGKYLYYLYKNVDDTIFVSSLPDWMCDGTNYLTLANCIIYHKGNLPNVKISVNDQTVSVCQNYLLPTSLLNFLLLYSWPSDFGNVNGFNRVIQNDIYNVFKNILDQFKIGVSE